MNVFHGTNSANAESVVLQVRVCLGGGELGKGFYACQDVSLAAAWAQGRFSGDDKVVEIEIPNAHYVQLSHTAIHAKEEMERIWKRLRSTNATKSFLFGFDVIVAPFATIDFSHQYKFETDKAESVLNSQSTRKVL